MLVRRAVVAREAPAPQPRVDLDDRGAPGRYVPAVERPEVDARPELPADEAQPGDAGVRGLRHRALDVEVEHGLGAAGPDLGQASPPRIALAGRAVAVGALAYEVDVDILVGRPVALEIVEEGVPLVLQPMRLEVPHGEREAVVDTNERRRIFG